MFSGATTGATADTWSAVIAPAAQPAATFGSCCSVRPLRTSWAAAAGDSRQCPRSQDAIVFSPSCSGACATSARRTVRAISASSRFRSATSAAVRSSRAGVGIP
jgi:hypothetical protein